MSSTILFARRCACAVLSASALLTGVMSPAVAAGPTQAEFDALRARVQETQDRQEIQQLIVEYGHLLDTHDLVGYSNLFARQGVWVGGFGTAQGPKAILAMMNKYIGTAPYDPKNVKGFHLLTNIIVHLDGGDRATAWSRIVYMTRNKDNKPAPAMGGHYDDTLIRENGHWKFLRRVVMMEIPFQDPRDIKGEPPPAPVSGADTGAEDRQQIEQLFADYGATLDRHDWEAFGRLFAEDAVFGGGAGEPARGRAAIQASLEKAITSNASRLPAPDFHVFFNPSIHVEGDHATAQSKGAYVIPDAHSADGVPGAAHMVFFCVYDDVLVRRAGHWLFQQRTLRSTMPPEPK
jgi:uncharacterized protein (TIGR02246 family)